MGLVAHQTFRASTAEDKLEEVQDTLVTVARNSTQALQHFEFLASEQRIRDLRRSLNLKEDLIQQAGNRTVDAYLESICSSDGMRGIKVKGEQLALDAYENFWQAMVEHQKRHRDGQTALRAVRITHSSSMRVWDTEVGRALIANQANYVRRGGVIIRILLDTEEKPNATVASFMEAMVRAGIHVYYLQDPRADRLLSDFLWVGPYELSWRAGASRETLKECELTEIGATRQEALRQRWNMLVERVIANSQNLPEAEKKTLLSSAEEASYENVLV